MSKSKYGKDIGRMMLILDKWKERSNDTVFSLLFYQFIDNIKCKYRFIRFRRVDFFKKTIMQNNIRTS